MAKATSSLETLTTLCNTLRAIASDDGVKFAETVVGRSSDLEKENKRLEAAFDVFSKKNALLLAEKEAGAKLLEQHAADIDKLKEEKAAFTKDMANAEKTRKEMKTQLDRNAAETAELQRQLKVKNGKIEGLEDDLKKEKSKTSAAVASQKKANNDLQTAQAKLKSVQDDLNRLKGYAVVLKELDRNEATKQLQALFDAAWSLAEAHVGIDFEDGILSDPVKWDKLHDSVKRISKTEIPLPRSNSLAAKQMRIAAFLATLAHALDRYIFQATYVLKDTKELSDRIIDLRDKRKANHLRAVLLHLFEKKDYGEAQSSVVVADVSNCMKPLLGEANYQAFIHALEETCQRILRVWREFQHRKDLVSSEFELDPDYLTDWKSLPISNPPVNGRQRGPGRLPAQINDASSGVGKAIWPPFFVFQEANGQYELIREGFMLNENQMREAMTEVQAQGNEQPSGYKRPPKERFRDRGRRDSDNGDHGDPRKPFLSRGAGDGSQGD